VSRPNPKPWRSRTPAAAVDVNPYGGLAHPWRDRWRHSAGSL